MELSDATEKSPATPAIDLRTFRLVAQCLNHYATPGPHFPKYHIKIILGDFNANLGREHIFKPTIGNDSMHEDSNDNVVTIVNFATSKILFV